MRKKKKSPIPLKCHRIVFAECILAYIYLLGFSSVLKLGRF